jgi:hypothetical protein
MPNPNPNTSGLYRCPAPDVTEELVVLTGRLEKSDWEWFRSLPGNKSYHLRQAVRLYRHHYNDHYTNNHDENQDPPQVALPGHPVQ